MSGVIVVDSDQPQQKGWRWWLIALILLILVAIIAGGLVVWATIPISEPDEVALAALASDEQVTVTTRAWLAFIPNTPPETGLIFYPGALVPAEAYAPLARQIAEAGYLVVVTYPPLNRAILNPNMAAPVLEHFSAVDHWAIGGHSLGGTTAAIFANANRDRIRGLFMVGAYPADDALRDSNLQVVSVYGTADLLVTPDEIEDSRSQYPVNAQFVRIEGGNHAQFGYYGSQNGDGEATISNDAQINQTVTAALSLLDSISR